MAFPQLFHYLQLYLKIIALYLWKLSKGLKLFSQNIFAERNIHMQI